MAGSDPRTDSSERAAPTRREHLAALLLAFACAVLFLRDGLLPGRALVPHPPELFDVYMAEARANGTFDEQDAFRGNVSMADKYLQSLCWDRVLHDRLRAGELPRWTRDIGGGAPFVPQMAQPWQPINSLLLLWPSVEWYGVWYLVHLVLFGWFAYLFVRRIGCAHPAALLALVAATLGMWTQCKLHHNVILTAALSLWPMLSATHELLTGARDDRRARGRAVAWLGLWSGLSWSTGFVVIALQATYLTAAWAGFLLLRQPRGERLRRLLPVGLGLGLGALVSLANMLPILLASRESARAATFDPQLLRALGLEWDHLLTLAWPDLLSWPSSWFHAAPEQASGYLTRMPLSQLVLLANPTRADGAAFQSWVETSFAVGLVPLGACVSALFSRPHRGIAWFFAAVAALAFGMATADEPFFSLARVLPGVSAGDLRRLLFLVAMPLVVLTGIGADRWLAGRALWPARATWLAVAAAAVVAIGWLWQNDDEASFVRAYVELYAMDEDHPEVHRQLQLLDQLPAVRDAADPHEARLAILAAEAARIAAPGEALANRAALATSAWRSLAIAVLALLLTWRRPLGGFGAATLVAVTTAELVWTGLGPVQTVPAERVTTPPKLLGPVSAQHVPDRPRPRLQRLVIAGAGTGESTLPGNLPGFLGFADGNAYNPLPKARYEQFFEAIEPGCAREGSGVGAFREPASLGHALCDLFGIRYVLARDDSARAAMELADDGALRDVTPDGTGRFRLLERTTTLPRATFVRRVDVLPAPDERLAALAEPERDVRGRVVLETDDAPRPADPDANFDAACEVTLHDDERVVVTVRCDRDGYLRLADPFDLGWTATLDGEPVEVLVADHYLRAVHVPGPGEHVVEFRYDGARVLWPLRLTLLGYGIVLALSLAGRRRTAT